MTMPRLKDPPKKEQDGLAASISCGLGAGLTMAAARLTGETPDVKHCLLMQLLKAAAMTAIGRKELLLDDGRLKQSPRHLFKPFCREHTATMGKVHGSLARAGKVRGQTPKVPKQDKKKKPTGRAMKRIKYNRRFVNVVVGFGKKKGPNSQ